MELSTNIYSRYSRTFDEKNSKYWTEDIERNKMFLKVQQNLLNELLYGRGYVFLNEVYERLGFPTSEEFTTIGWAYDPKNNLIDNYISFGLEEPWKEFDLRPVLDFNVDGVVDTEYLKS